MRCELQSLQSAGVPAMLAAALKDRPCEQVDCLQACCGHTQTAVACFRTAGCVRCGPQLQPPLPSCLVVLCQAAVACVGHVPALQVIEVGQVGRLSAAPLNAASSLYVHYQRGSSFGNASEILAALQAASQGEASAAKVGCQQARGNSSHCECLSCSSQMSLQAPGREAARLTGMNYG